MISGGGAQSPKWVLHRHGAYVRIVTMCPSSSQRAEVGIVETGSINQAVRLCTKKNADRLAHLINLHEPYQHMHWKAIQL